MKFPVLKLGLVFTVLVCVSSAAAADEAYGWLIKMNRAARTLNYEGTFVYQHGDHIEPMRIYHAVVHGAVRERLVSLNGAAREIIRDSRGVRCYLPDQDTVLVEHSRVGGKSFPSILPGQLRDLDKDYRIELGQPAVRVLGRPTQLVVIRPRDDYRYGYYLWADKQTGLLLKASLIDRAGRPLEQFLFTQIRIGDPIKPADLRAQTRGRDLVWRQENNEPLPAADGAWTVTELPPGFRLSARLKRTIPGHAPVDHYVYSDGLAAVSVFIERERQAATPVILGPGRMGAVHAFGRVVGDHQVTVVGEVPAQTVIMIGNSVIRKNP